MAKRKYAIGVDFGTESGRAVLVDVLNGKELSTSVYKYSHGVIDEVLPVEGKQVRLEPDWALQDPEDYIRTFKRTIPAVLESLGVDPADVIGLGIDFTACTMLPTLADGTPLCVLPDYRRNPHSWVKLWKHHAAQPEADKINETARKMGEAWLDRYGGKISSEWFFSKTLQILDEAPEIYNAADRLLEAADWVVWQLTGVETRNSCTAGYKAMWSKREGFPCDDYFAALDPRLEHVIDQKMSRQILSIGDRAGSLTAQAAKWTGLKARYSSCGCQCGCACFRSGGHCNRTRTNGCHHGHQHLPYAFRSQRTTCPRYMRIRRRRNHSRVYSGSKPVNQVLAISSPGLWTMPSHLNITQAAKKQKRDIHALA